MQARKIVVPTDFSESSEAALRLGTSLARDTGAILHIVHVKEPFATYKLAGHYGDLPPFPELDTLRAVLEKVVPTDPNVPYRHWLLTSEHASKEILRFVKELDADLIVMGTHGRTGLARLLVGSVAESVIRHSPCPVLTIKHPRLAIVEPMPALLPS